MWFEACILTLQTVISLKKKSFFLEFFAKSPMQGYPTKRFDVLQKLKKGKAYLETSLLAIIAKYCVLIREWSGDVYEQNSIVKRCL